MNGLQEGWVVLYRAPRVKPCHERGLVLTARNIPHAIVQERGGHGLAVPMSAAELASRELALYEKENLEWPPSLELPPPAVGAKSATALYAGILILCYAFQVGNAFARDWVGAGAAHAQAIREGEWWRSVTALTLHADVPHLLSNVIYGSFFGFLNAYVLGGGLGWLTVLAAGVLGNLTNAWLQDPGHLSIGASTAVFGAVGAMAGAEWRRRRLFREPRLRRAAPVVVALLLLTTMGMSPEPGGNQGIDVLAHCTGLAWGIPLGYIASTYEPRHLKSPGVQAGLGFLVLGLCAVAWGAAFLSV